VFGKRSKVDQRERFVHDKSGSGAPKIYPYSELASAVSKAFPGHTMVHADATTAYTKADGMKYSIPFSQNTDSTYAFQQPRLGGHPAWVDEGDLD
jgi:hypothetical protein